MSEIAIGLFNFKVDPAGADFFLEVSGLGVGIRNRVSREDLNRLARRMWMHGHDGAPRPAPELIAQIIDAGYRSLAKAEHPDTGGNDESMANLNAAVEWIRSELTR